MDTGGASGGRGYCTIPLASTVQTVSLASLTSLKPAPRSGRAADLEEEDAFWMVPEALTRYFWPSKVTGA